MNAKFIVIEGLEGAGKSSAIQVVVETLQQNGINRITRTREPGGTVLAEKLRALVKEEHPGEELQDITELLLVYAARVQLVENVIKPALARGNGWWVIAMTCPLKRIKVVVDRLHRVRCKASNRLHLEISNPT